nr:choline/ethanolamine kinase family protein [uncultured Dongia sp.]
MILDDDIEDLFRTIPLLAGTPRAAWQVTALGGITNRSYRLRAGDLDLVLRWPGASASRYLDRSAEPANASAVAELGLSPRVLAADPAQGWYITAYETGARPLTDDDFADATVFAEVIALLTTLHRAPIRFPFQQGLFQAIDLYLTLAPTPRMLDLRRRLDPVQAALARNRLPMAPCHIDPNPANFLRCADGRLQLIDWEFAAMEEPLWDLAAVSLEADSPAHTALIASLIGTAQMPRFELYKTTINLVAASWCEAEIVAGNDSADLMALRDQRIQRLEQRLADPCHVIWLQQA